MSQLMLFVEPVAPNLQAIITPTSLVCCDVLVYSYRDEKTSRIRVKPLDHQPFPSLLVRCSHKARVFFPIGTIFKIDVRVTHGSKGKQFLIARAKKPLLRAVEYFEHNISLQKNGSPAL